jgi:hypothetical protein
MLDLEEYSDIMESQSKFGNQISLDFPLPIGFTFQLVVKGIFL